MATHHKGTREEGRALDAYVKLLRCTNAVQGKLEAQLREVGFTENQFGVLETLYHLGPMHQHQLGSKLLTSRANITLIVDQLAEKGLVRRERDTHDRRYMTVHLTGSGRKLIARAFPQHVQRIIAAFSSLNAQEQVSLAKLCRKLGLSQGADM